MSMHGKPPFVSASRQTILMNPGARYYTVHQNINYFAIHASCKIANRQMHWARFNAPRQQRI